MMMALLKGAQGGLKGAEDQGSWNDLGHGYKMYHGYTPGKKLGNILGGAAGGAAEAGSQGALMDLQNQSKLGGLKETMKLEDIYGKAKEDRTLENQRTLAGERQTNQMAQIQERARVAPQRSAGAEKPDLRTRLAAHPAGMAMAEDFGYGDDNEMKKLIKEALAQYGYDKTLKMLQGLSDKSENPARTLVSGPR